APDPSVAGPTLRLLEARVLRQRRIALGVGYPSSARCLLSASGNDIWRSLSFGHLSIAAPVVHTSIGQSVLPSSQATIPFQRSSTSPTRLLAATQPARNPFSCHSLRSPRAYFSRPATTSRRKPRYSGSVVTSVICVPDSLAMRVGG